jgi:DNA-directed RNA polymerase subunit M/transcription elongation factor TFIIS
MNFTTRRSELTAKLSAVVCDPKISMILELEIYKKMLTMNPGSTTCIADYESTFNVVYRGLSNCALIHPDDTYIEMIRNGHFTCEMTVDKLLNPPSTDPRDVIRNMFIKSLCTVGPIYSEDKIRVTRVANLIEVSCYNAVIRLSKIAEYPLQRHWSSPLFLDMYSSRCGTINEHISTTSLTHAAYGPVCLDRLLNRELLPSALGSLSVVDICPDATAAEREEIIFRSKQKINLKESNMFRCPNCGARRSVYTEVQRRALDEAPDYLCQCMQCNRRFKGQS